MFSDGQIAKVDDYKIHRDEIELFVPGGGSYTTELARVESIVDDEIIVPPAEVDSAKPKPALYDAGFHDGRLPVFPSRYDTLIAAECKRQNVDVALVSSLIKAESNFDPYARSRKGARGLMQLMPATGARLGVRRFFDPAANIRAGVAYLRELIDRYPHHPELVLAAYNAGENAVAVYGGIPPFRETVGYVKRVLGWWHPITRVEG